MKIGIGSWTFPWAVGVEGYPKLDKPLKPMDILCKGIEMEVEVVQICDNLPLHKLTEEELKIFAKTAVSHGIDIETGTRGVNPELLNKYLEISVKLNSKLLRTIIDTPDTQEGIIEARENLERVLPAFEKAGVVIAIENHEGHKAKDLASIVQELNSKNLGICLDTVNSFGALETMEKVVAELAPYVVNLHMKDFDISRIKSNFGFEIFGCCPGKGKLDMDYIVNLLKEKGRDFNIILEQWPPFMGDIAETVSMEEKWAVAGVKFLKELK